MANRSMCFSLHLHRSKEISHIPIHLLHPSQKLSDMAFHLALNGDVAPELDSFESIIVRKFEKHPSDNQLRQRDSFLKAKYARLFRGCQGTRKQKLIPWLRRLALIDSKYNRVDVMRGHPQHKDIWSEGTKNRKLIPWQFMGCGFVFTQDT